MEELLLMSFATWIAFVLTTALIAAAPGASAVLSMSHGLSYGVKKTSATIAGLQLGMLTIFAVAGAGVGSLLLASEFAFDIVKTVGAVYLIYMGAMQWRARVDVPASPDARLQGDSAPSVRKRLLIGYLTNATNPKAVIFMVAILPQFISRALPLLPQLLILATTMCAIDLVVMHGYAFLAASMQRYFRDPLAVKKQNRLFGGMLIAVGTALFFVRRGASH